MLAWRALASWLLAGGRATASTPVPPTPVARLYDLRCVVEEAPGLVCSVSSPTVLACVVPARHDLPTVRCNLT
jgi:hypothetical protein